MDKGGWLSGLLTKLRGGEGASGLARAPASARGAPTAPGRAPAPWPGDVGNVAGGGAAAAAARLRPPARVQMSAFLRQRIRERFLGSRFRGVAHGAQDLGRTDEVIRTARLFFEDGDVDRACEWLAFASDANPDERLWLAQLEILFLTRQGAAYAAVAADFRKRFAVSAAWAEVARLGVRLAPADPLFAGASTAEADTHYGPWPQVQNWIEAPYDLTGDVLAAEFHAAMAGGGGVAIAAKAE